MQAVINLLNNHSKFLKIDSLEKSAKSPYTKGAVLDLIHKYNLPNDGNIEVNGRNITVTWNSQKSLQSFKNQYPVVFHKNDWLYTPLEKVVFDFLSEGSIAFTSSFYGQTGWYEKDFHTIVQKGRVTPEEGSLKIQIQNVIEEK